MRFAEGPSAPARLRSTTDSRPRFPQQSPNANARPEVSCFWAKKPDPSFVSRLERLQPGTTSGLLVIHSERQIGNEFLPLAIGSEAIAVARTTGARCFRSASSQRSGRR